MTKKSIAASVKQTIEETIAKNALIERGDCVVLGLSGGPDSACLFDVLCELSKEQGFELCAVHINHCLRGSDSDEDQSYVEALCKERGIRCFSFREDCNAAASEQGIGCEEAGRLIRYSRFAETAGLLEKEAQNGKRHIRIALAHNLNDQAETVLFRIIRGSGTDGLAGMDYERRDESGYKIIRPLLDCKRSEIENYCREKGLNPRIDKTNEEALYTRNKIRLELIPYIEENFNENFTESLVRLAAVARQDRDRLNSEAEALYEEPLDVETLKTLPKAIRHRLISAALENKGLERDITMSHLEACDRIIENPKANSSVDFPHGYSFRIAYGKAYAYKQDEAEEEPPKLSEEEKALGAVWRHRQSGDYMKIKISAAGEELRYGKKKIQDIFTDKKVPKADRDRIYLLCVGSMVIRIAYDFDKKSIN